MYLTELPVEVNQRLLEKVHSLLEDYAGELRVDADLSWTEKDYEVADAIKDLEITLGWAEEADER